MTRRWPTLLGLLGGAAGLFAVFSDDDGVGFAAGVAVMALIYMITLAWGRPGAAWIAFPISSVLLAGLVIVGDDLAWSVTGLIVALVLAWLVAVFRGAAKDGKWFTIETLGGLFFGGLALAALAVDVKLGGVLAGLGFLLHGVWDAFHYVKNKVVARSYAEACAVVDIIIGVALPISVMTS